MAQVGFPLGWLIIKNSKNRPVFLTKINFSFVKNRYKLISCRCLSDLLMVISEAEEDKFKSLYYV